MISLVFSALLAAAPEPTRFALIIGNNDSPVQHREALSYADDDALRYALAFDGVVDDERRIVLATLDRDSSRYEGLGVVPRGPPTVAAVRAAFVELKDAIGKARAEGKPTALYFLFAGHGDVRDGEGFLELADGTLGGKALQDAIEGTHADEAHLVLDSCNSFFVVSPRKPGGRRYATSAELVATLGRRLPNVGVFLSTSSAAETWEWSELEAGVFSHLVRSGLAGPADLDGDGAVSYRELRRFVAVASGDVRNPRLRPVVYARGPFGDDDRPFVRLPTARVVGFTGGPRRLSIRDLDGVRWLDLHVEEGHPVSVRVSERLAPWLRIDSSEGEQRIFGTDLTTRWSELRTLSATTTARGGGSSSLAALFQTPFGPRSAQAAAAAEGREMSFGVTPENFATLLATIDRLDSIDHAERTRGLLVSTVASSTMAAFGGLLFGLRNASCSSWCELQREGAVWLGAGLVGGAITGIDFAFSLEEGRHLRRLATAARASTADPNHLASWAESTFVDELRARRKRHAMLGLGYGLALGVTVVISTATTIDDSVSGRGISFRTLAFEAVAVGVLVTQLINELFRSDESDRLMSGWLTSQPASGVSIALSVTTAGVAVTGTLP